MNLDDLLGKAGDLLGENANSLLDGGLENLTSNLTENISDIIPTENILGNLTENLGDNAVEKVSDIVGSIFNK